MIRYTARALLATLGLAAGASGRVSAGTGPEPTPQRRFDQVTLATGVRLHYAEQGDPHGPAVILLHGYSDSWFSWSRVLPLIPARYHVIAPDARGHGDSDKPESGYSTRDFADDVLALMDALGLERATIVGHSMGSFVAQQVAVAAPQRVQRLVLVGSAPSFEMMSGVKEFADAVYALEDPVPEQFAREFQVSTIHQPIPAAFLDTAVATSLRLPANVWHRIMTGMLATPASPELAKLGIPILILSGDRDAVFSPAAQQALMAELPEARSSIYAETGHAPHWERPERFAGDLVKFLGRDTRR
ncbi:MAG TPA: alpha/beta hydrolase [Gemmatimonadales bacterium]|nr:alpha/beta hydrolase [Gemmatimonadales bacterium]